MVPCFLHNKTGSSALLWVHGVSALCLGCRVAGKSVFFVEKKCLHSPCGGTLFLGPHRRRTGYRIGRGWMIFMMAVF